MNILTSIEDPYWSLENFLVDKRFYSEEMARSISYAYVDGGYDGVISCVKNLWNDENHNYENFILDDLEKWEKERTK